jgi:hypothetical protein
MATPDADSDGTAENPSDLYRRVTAYLTELGYLPPEQPGEVGTLWRKPEPRDSRNYTVAVYYEMRPDGMDWESVSDRIAWLEGIPADTVRARCGTDAEREEWLTRRVEQLNDEIRVVFPRGRRSNL